MTDGTTVPIYLMTLRATPLPLRALLAAILALAALALVPQLAIGAVETPTEEPAPPPTEAEATEESEEEATEEGEVLPPPPGPPVEEEPPVEETPPEGTEEETTEVVPPPVEETPPPPDPEPVIVEEEVVQTEILVIPETPDVPVAPKMALSKQVIGPPPTPPAAPDRASLPALKAATPPGPVALPAPSLADTPPALPPPSDVPPPVAPAPPETTTGTPLVDGISRFVPTLGVEQSRPGAETSAVLPDDGGAAPPSVESNVAQDALGPTSRPDSLIGVLASYVIPGASGPASSFQFMLAFALLLGAFAFARPRNWSLALPDVPGRAHAGHGSVGLRPG